MSLLKKKQKKNNSLAIFATAAFGLQIIVILGLIVQGMTIRQLSLRKPLNFVELVNGERVTIDEKKTQDPEVIRQFIIKTMELMFNWTGNLPPQTLEEVANPKPDPGITIIKPEGGSAKVTTGSWIASFSLSEDFRKGFLSKLAEITPPEVFSDNPTQTISAQLKLKRVTAPEQIDVGKWRVGIVADLIQQKRADGRKIVIPFNKDILIQTIDYFPYPLPQQMTDLQQAIYSVRSEQLEIYEIRNLCLLDNDSSSDEPFKQC
ncbi:conserved hypothetical protein [Gloeothece citriformis PCC 7424]|uniref:Uncharacterized protein n=1 Tax=Gloeothece citriformis (strain PCC 7424) TaxID=65393 RepID=B7KCM7_GLOC7|nr:hypothetical protein [Gloeothece citriformis]ACK71578.1 conserved hypothetical protein [Gloeothece citriformis PCC 7424]